MNIFWCLIIAFGAAAVGAMGAALALSGHKIEAIAERCRADVAHAIGDQLADELREMGKRRDIGFAQRERIDVLLARWAALTPTTAPDPDFLCACGSQEAGPHCCPASPDEPKAAA